MTQASVTTIGFTKTDAKGFFERLTAAKVRVLFDVRLNTTSQLAGFAKSSDLAFFLDRICGIKYSPQPILAPTNTMLKAYKIEKGDWNVYEQQFISLMSERQIERQLSASMFDGACLLCSEATPHRCHRRLVCDYLNQKWSGTLKVQHL